MSMKRATLPKDITIKAGAALTEAPAKIEHYTTHYEAIIGIGNDHTARLIIDEDALRELRNKDVKTYVVIG